MTKQYINPETQYLTIKAQTVLCASEPAPACAKLPNVTKAKGSWE